MKQLDNIINLLIFYSRYWANFELKNKATINIGEYTMILNSNYLNFCDDPSDSELIYLNVEANML